MTFEAPIVVVAEGLEGLRAAAWLAARGLAVRLLFVGAVPAAVAEPLLSGEHGRLDPILGPLRPAAERPFLHLRTGFVPVPGHRRDVARLAGVGPVERARDWWSGTRRLPPDLGAWGRQRFGATAWTLLVAPLVAARLGAGVDVLHRGLGPLLAARPDGPWWAPAQSGEVAVASWIAAVHAADGEVLDHVEVIGLEVEHGRAVAVLTDHGREHAGTLVTDVGPARLAPWLPAVDGVPDPIPDCADAVDVLLTGDAGHLPAVLFTEHARLVRPPGPDGVPSTDRIRVALVADGLASWSDEALVDRARVAAAGLVTGEAVGIVRRPVQVPRPAPATEGAAYRWLARLTALRIWPVGPRVLLVPMVPRDEIDTTVAVLDHVPPVEVRGGRLGLVPSRPWVLVQ